MSNVNTATNPNNDEDGFVEVGGGGKASVFIKPGYLEEDDMIQGIFENLNPKVGKFGHACLFIKLTKPLTYGDNLNAAKTYEIGEAVGINVTGQLKSLMERSDAQKGDVIRLTYAGQQTLGDDHKFAGSKAHTFKMAVRKPTETAPEALPE
jgi:hypothetical protein